MRHELFTHPRFVSLCKKLIYENDEPGFLVYVCGGDALQIGELPASNESVTDRALRCVTECALRDVLMVTLLKVWCSVNAHCKVSGLDAIVTPASADDLDEVAGFSGFGRALVNVGWVIERDHNVLAFPNFLDWNEPACLRKPSLSNKERQRRHREKLKSRRVDSRAVTKVTKSNGRGEERREEIDTSKDVSRGKSKFTKPTVTEVAAYCLERNNGIDPQAFVDHYESKGWVVGKSPMKSWQAAVRTWERSEHRRKPVSRVATQADLASWSPIDGGIGNE